MNNKYWISSTVPRALEKPESLRQMAEAAQQGNTQLKKREAAYDEAR